MIFDGRGGESDSKCQTHTDGSESHFIHKNEDLRLSWTSPDLKPKSNQVKIMKAS